MQKTTKNSTALVWFRNDLRIHDNEVLYTACMEHESVIGIYCLDPRQFKTSSFGFKKTDVFRAKFLLETIDDLRANLKNLNITLLVYNGYPEAVIPKVCNKNNVDAVYFQKEWTQEEKEIEEKTLSKLPSNLVLNSYYNQFLFHPEDINIEIKAIPQVFTVFRKKLEKYVKVRPELVTAPKASSNCLPDDTKIPTIEELGYTDFTVHPHTAFPFKGGENEALQRLQDYFFTTKRLGVYKKTRNGLIGVDYSSKFSAWLANGSLSARTIYWNIKHFEKTYFKNESTYWLIFELIWRDYFKYISLKHDNAIFKIGGILNHDYHWNKSQKLINQWINGETSEPFVNANMIELKTTGWMSNRGRQNVASYFAKELQLDWRIGASYFESMLIDYDVHSNYGNWMYVAGVGNDPRDRKFNVQLQAERYDTDYKFRKLWLQTTLF